MSDTTFISQVTQITAPWAQDVNNTVYHALGSGGVAPTTPQNVIDNLGLSGATGASKIGFSPVGGLVSTQVQAAIAEVNARIPVASNSATYVNVKDYGAIGNGVADDTTAINTALAVLNGTLGGTLYFPRGTYKITSTLVIPILVGGASRIRFLGEGFASTITPGSAMTTMVKVLGSLTSIEELNFENSGGLATRAVQVGDTGSTPGLPASGQNVYIRGNRFSSFAVGIYAWDFTSIDVIGNVFVACTTSYYSGDNSNDSKIIGNFIQGGGPCLYFTRGGAGGQQAEGVIIAANTIFSNGTNSGSGIVFNGGLEIKIFDNVIGEVTQYPSSAPGWGVELDGSTYPIAFAQVTNNWMGGSTTGAVKNGFGGFYTHGTVQSVKVMGNTISTFSGYGIDLDGAGVVDCVISGNTIYNVNTADISLNNPVRIFVKNNICNANGVPGTTYSIIEQTNTTQSIVTENTFLNKSPTKSTQSLYRDNFGVDVVTGLTSTSRGLRGALMRQTSPQNVPTGAGVPTQMVFGATEWDTDGCVTSTTTITTPAWATKAKITAAVLFETTSTVGDRTIAVARNGSFSYNYQPNCVSIGSGTGYIWHNPTLHSAWIPTSPGDTWSVWAGQNSGGTLATNPALGTWFQVEFM